MITATQSNYGTGRRKSAVARVYIKSGNGAIVVNGKYRTVASEAGGYTELMELIDELTIREGLR